MAVTKTIIIEEIDGERVMTDPATCDHIDYDDYFEKCSDCGLTGEQIHRAVCVPQEDWELTEDGLCSKCGTILVIE